MAIDITRAAESLFYTQRHAEIIDAAIPALREKAKELSSPHDNKGFFGMSKAGGCTRAVAGKWLGWESKPISGSTQFTFFQGHLMEPVVFGMFSLMGLKPNAGQMELRYPPMFLSWADMTVEIDGKSALASVKTSSYKMSGYNWKTKTWKRHGFAELPLEGVQGAQPGHWAQSQLEMLASGIHQTLYFVVSKDIVKAYEGDEYMGQNGSLCFYSEIIPYDEHWTLMELVQTWETTWKAAQNGEAGKARYLSKNSLMYKRLHHAPEAKSDKSAENKAATGTFDPCQFCDLVEACRKAK